jgi:hypothetical protein
VEPIQRSYTICIASAKRIQLIRVLFFLVFQIRLVKKKEAGPAGLKPAIFTLCRLHCKGKEYTVHREGVFGASNDELCSLTILYTSTNLSEMGQSQFFESISY